MAGPLGLDVRPRSDGARGAHGTGESGPGAGDAPGGAPVSAPGRTRRTVGLALGAGGLAGAAHVGVLSVLEEAGIPVDAVAGTSAGAIVGALFAAGWSAAEISDLARSLRPSDVYDSNLRPWPLLRTALAEVLRRLHLPAEWLGPVPRGLIPGRKLLAKLESWTGGRTIDGLPKPFVAVAAALETGDRVLFGPTALARQASRLADPAVVAPGATCAFAARASSAIPVVFEPVDWGGRTLVDGGLVDDAPTDALRALGAEVVVAVALGLRHRPAPRPRGIVDTGARALDALVASAWREDVRHHGADLVIEPRVPSLPLSDFASIPDAIEAGALAAREVLPALGELVFGGAQGGRPGA